MERFAIEVTYSLNKAVITDRLNNQNKVITGDLFEQLINLKVDCLVDNVYKKETLTLQHMAWQECIRHFYLNVA